MTTLWSQDLFYKAFNYAAKAHNGQKLPSSDLPYIIHIACVCSELMVAIDDTVDGNLVIQCGALHDTLEDTFTTLDFIESEFGKEIAAGVNALSKNRDLEKALQVEDSINRILAQPREIWMVKMADRITNLNPPPDFWSHEKRENYFIQSEFIYNSLKTANLVLAERLRNKILGYQFYL